MKRKTIFLTGATGFLGSHLANHLCRLEYAVIALTHRRSDEHLDGRVRRVQGDIAAPRSYAGALAEADIVCHLAADYRLGPLSGDGRRAMSRANVEGTRAIIDCALACDIERVVYISSTAALGESGVTPGDEANRHNGVFRSYYEETKHVAHGIAADRQAAGAPVSIAILGGVFGAGDASVLAKTMRDYLAGALPFQVATSSGFNLCDVDSVVDGLLRIISAEETGTWILAGEEMSMPKLLSMLAELADRPEPRALSPRLLAPVARALDAVSRLSGVEFPLSREALEVMDGSRYVYSSAKAIAELGWHPAPLRASLPAYVRTLEGRR